MHELKAQHFQNSEAKLITVPLLGHTRVAVEVECPGLKVGKAVIRKIRVQVGLALALGEMTGSSPRVVSLKDVKEGLARESRQVAEFRERKRKWIMSGGNYEEDWARKKARDSPYEQKGWLAEFCEQSIQAIKVSGCSPINELLDKIHDLSIFAKPFYFKDTDGTLNPLSYSPMLSILSLDFTGSPSIRLEYPYTLYAADGLN